MKIDLSIWPQSSRCFPTISLQERKRGTFRKFCVLFWMEKIDILQKSCNPMCKYIIARSLWNWPDKKCR